MKNEILERAMFAMPLSKDARNSGIMAGFEDEMPEDMEEESMEEMPPMARTPQNPEILMNTLRGDMRSTNARVQELAQMVGEQAAQETPPEVLALLQAQLAAPQGGIGALPQGQQMAPPPMGMPPQGGAMPPPQGGMPPPGMEGAGPFPQGGAEQAPPTPDGMPPITAAAGAFITPFTRAAQFMGDKAAQYGPAINQYLGNLTMRAQPTVQRVTGGSPPMPLSVQGRETLVQGPAGTIVEGVGTRMAPYTTMGPLMSPTFTEGIKMGVQRTAQEYPRVAEALSRMSPALALGTGALSALPFMKDSSTPISADQQASYNDKMAQLSAIDRTPSSTQQAAFPVAPAATAATTDAEQAAIDQRQIDAAAKVDTNPLGTFINQKLKAKGKPLSKIERIKASQAEYGPLFEELLGSDKESAKINALLLLSEAGLKLASTAEPTFAMAVSKSFANVPRGVAAIAAQERELGLKTKSAALQQAISDVGAEDAAAAARQKVFLEGTMRMELEKFKNQGYIAKDGGAGLITYETKNGSRVGESLNPAYVDALKQNPIAVLFNDPDVNPFVRDVGAARTVVQRDPKQRNLLEEDLNQITTQLNIVRDMKAVVADAYSPGTFFTGVKNEYLVPLLPNAIVRPDLNKAQVTNTLKNGFSDLSRGRASQNGRLTNMQEQYNRDNDVAISKPDGLLQNPELAAKTLNTKETSLLNEWYNTATRLGVFDRDRVLSTPPTGTRNDPFLMPTDAASNAQMQSYLKSTFSTVRDPNAKIYIRDAATNKVYDLSIQNLLTPRPQ